MVYKLGKKPAVPGAVKLKFRHYAKTLPPIPAEFGHESLISDWKMLANDSWGDCIFAGSAHETMLWHAESKNPVVFNDECVLSDYSAVTGFDPNDPYSDQGANMLDAMKYRRTTGLLDASGERHTIEAYLDLEPGNWEDLLAASYLFGATGLGIQVPESAMGQFEANQPWDVVPGDRVEGGHYIPAVALRGNLWIVTWGRLQQMTRAFYEKYCDEAVAILSKDPLIEGVSPEGFNYTQLRDDLAQITK